MPATPVPGGSYRYWKFLDGLRGFGLIAILGIHGQVPHMQGGFIGLDLFFILSGFLITMLLLEEWKGTGRIKFGDFYLRRAFRLLPALFVLFAVINLYAMWTLPHDAVVGIRQNTLYGLLYILNWAGVHFLAPLTMLSHTWSLSVEEQFYFCWPWLLLALLWLPIGRVGRTAVVFGGALASIAARMWFTARLPPGSTRSFVLLDTRADGLLLGCAIAMLLSWQLLPRGRGVMRAARVAATGSAVLLTTFIFTMRPDRDLPSGLTLVSFTGAVLILSLLLAPGTLVQRVLESGPLVWLGRRSYSIYLWHFPLLVAPLPLLGWAHSPVRWPYELPFFALRVVLAMLIAIASYEWIERPCLRLRARWSHVRAAVEATPAPIAPALMPASPAEVLE